MDEAGEKISLIYDGELASTGQLHFYEYSRAIYGFSRFVTTVELFRRTERVPGKITSKQQYVPLIISAPERGSFPIDIIAPIATQVSSELLKVPLNVFIQYVMSQVQRLLPSEESAILKAGGIQLEIEKQRRLQSREETQRVQLITTMVGSQNVTAQSALALLGQAQEQNSRTLNFLENQTRDLATVRDRLDLMEKRENTFESFREHLEKIDTDKMLKLTRKVRPQLKEIGLPLRRSASILSIASGRSRDVIARLDQKEIEDINDRDLEEESSEKEVRFISYDRDMGIGKLDLVQEQIRRVSYSVPPGLRRRLKPKILKSINEDNVTASVRAFRDPGGAVTSLVVDNVTL